MKFDVNDYFDKLDGDKNYWVSFLEEERIEIGVLKLNPRVIDVQNPHSKDEIYHIIEGNGYLNIDGVDHEISPGSVYYVKRNTKHKFHGNTTTIKCVYFLN